MNVFYAIGILFQLTSLILHVQFASRSDTEVFNGGLFFKNKTKM